VILRRNEYQEVRFGADNHFIRPEPVNIRSIRIVLNHVVDVEDVIDLLLWDRREHVTRGDVLPQIGIDPRKTIDFSG
jgi:hypothetical protein